MKKRKLLKEDDLLFIDKMTNDEKSKIKGGQKQSLTEDPGSINVSVAVSF